jgi:hypothetical protein
MRPATRFTLAALLAPILLLAATAGPARAEMPLPQSWWGRVVLPEGVQPGLTGDRFELTVSHLSTDKEAATLLEHLRTGGQMGLQQAMFRLPAKGFFRIGKLAAAEVTVIRVFDTEDGRRVLRLFCDFPIRLYDKSEPIAEKEHPFAYLELVVGPSGEGGTGTLIAAASLGFSEDGLRVETAATPVMSVVDVIAEPAPPRRP